MTTNCRFELHDWRLLDQSKSIKTNWRSECCADCATLKKNCWYLCFVQSGNETGMTNCRLESRDWHLLHQPKPLKVLKCLRLARHSVTIAELCATQAQSDNKSEPTTCRFESRDRRSLGQQKESKQFNSELFAYLATFSNNHRCFPKCIGARESHSEIVDNGFLKRKSAHEKDKKLNDLSPASKGQRLHRLALWNGNV